MRSGHLAGAALDVQRHEPMPDDDPLWSAPGITITPHIAAQSSPEVIAGQFVAALRARQRGERVPNAIDRYDVAPWMPLAYNADADKKSKAEMLTFFSGIFDKR